MKEQMRGNITIESKIPEQDFVESLLNMKHSGYDITFLFFFHCMANSWEGNKVFYYLNLLGLNSQSIYKESR